MARYCTYCGNEVNENAVVCVKCGCAIPNSCTNNNKINRIYISPETLVTTITQRIKTESIIWIVIGSLQILIGILNWFVLIVGILNLVSAICDLKFCKSFAQRPVGIVAKVKPIGGTIGVLIYNLLIGAGIGVLALIYYFIAVRGYVLENEQAFLEIENQCISSSI